jgi:hypothetical protein
MRRTDLGSSSGRECSPVGPPRPRSRDNQGVPPVLPPLPDEEHRCATCRFAYPAISVDAAMDAIRTVPERVGDAVRELPDEQLRARPSKETWSALEYVCHLRDVYAVYTIRLYRTRVEDTPVLEPMLNDLRVVRFRYNQRDVRPVVAELGDNVAGLLDEAARNTEGTWERVARRLPGEERTARWLVRQAAHEGLHHLRDIQRGLDRVSPRPS